MLIAVFTGLLMIAVWKQMTVDLHKHTRERQKIEDNPKKKHTRIWASNQTLHHCIVSSIRQSKDKQEVKFNQAAYVKSRLMSNCRQSESWNDVVSVIKRKLTTVIERNPSDDIFLRFLIVPITFNDISASVRGFSTIKLHVLSIIHLKPKIAVNIPS